MPGPDRNPDAIRRWSVVAVRLAPEELEALDRLRAPSGRARGAMLREYLREALDTMPEPPPLAPW